MTAKYPGVENVIHGNGAVAEVMGRVCGGVIGYPITPSTEISEIYEAFRANGGINVWGKHPFFFEPEGEHSAQSGALGAALTGGKYVSNASSSQGILYGMESHYVTVGKKVGGFVLHVAARVVSKHSLNVMAGHDDVYALLPSGYTVLFGSNAQEAADLAAISYKISAISLIPVANAMDGFATSHMMSEARMPEPELLREYLGDPAGRIKCPTVAQDMLFGAKGRVFQLKQYLLRVGDGFATENLRKLRDFLAGSEDAIEADNEGALIEQTLAFVPEELRAQWRRQWLNAHEKGTRQLVPALVDVHNPGLTGGVQNQPDFQAGSVDHRTHFVSEVPRIAREAMKEYSALTGREYGPIMTYFCDDAEYVMIGLGSVTDDAHAVATYLRGQGKKVGVISVKLLQPFPDAEVVAALAGKKAVTVLERSDVTALTGFVREALFKARENVDGERHPGIPPLLNPPKITTAIFGLGAHDLQPRHLVAAYKNMETRNAPFVYLGSQFYAKNPPPKLAELQARLRAAYPGHGADGARHGAQSGAPAEAGVPHPLPFGRRLRHDRHRQAPHRHSRRRARPALQGRAQVRLGEERRPDQLLHHPQPRAGADHQRRARGRRARRLARPQGVLATRTRCAASSRAGRSSSSRTSIRSRCGRSCRKPARKTIRDKKIKVFIIDAFEVAKKHAPTAGPRDAHDGHRLHRRGLRQLRPRHRGRRGRGDPQEDPLADREEVRRQGRPRRRRQHGGDPRRPQGDARARIRQARIPRGREGDGAQERALGRHLGVDVPRRALACAVGLPRRGILRRHDGLGLPRRHDRRGAGHAGRGHVPARRQRRLQGQGPVPPQRARVHRGLVHRLHGMRARLPGRRDPELGQRHPRAPDDRDPPTRHRREPARGAEAGGLSAHRRGARGLPHGKQPAALDEIVRQAAEALDVENPVTRGHLARLANALATYPVAKTRPFFDAMEKAHPGSGGLFSATVDPWKCTGCLECVEVCGPHALVAREQDQALLETLQARFEFLSRLPNTPSRFIEGAIEPEGDTKRLMLDRNNYYATTGGHGACRGCGEVTAIRLVTGTNHAIHDRRRKDHMRVVESLIDKLNAKLPSIEDNERDPHRKERVRDVIATLEKRLYLLESGPRGHGPASAVIANATGCSSVYASTFPFNPYNDPWVNSLFQDTPAVAKGVFEGLGADASGDIRALRIAELELGDEYDPETHDRYFRTFSWADFTADELALMPTVISMGGDGATYDIGFGALSRVLSTTTPIKVVVLNSGAYSNTGGQASTASVTAQDSDLSRYGAAHHGKQDERKELALLAAFHPNVFVVQSCASLQGHFLKNVVEFINHNDSPGVLDVYTPCQGEQGIADPQANRHARMAVDSRFNPVFVHDPRRGASLHDRFSLEGNPEVGRDWATTVIEHVEGGETKLLEVPMTPADFALTEGRFRKQFRVLAEGGRRSHPRVHRPRARRSGGQDAVRLVDRRGEEADQGGSLAGHRPPRAGTSAQLAQPAGARRPRCAKARRRPPRRDGSAAASAQGGDGRARILDRLDRPRHVRARGLVQGAADRRLRAERAVRPRHAADRERAGCGARRSGRQKRRSALSYAEEDVAKCSNCKTCYQELPELFEKTRIVVSGEAKEVGHLIPGALARVKVTPELRAKVARVAANCDSEIIHEQ